MKVQEKSKVKLNYQKTSSQENLEILIEFNKEGNKKL